MFGKVYWNSPSCKAVLDVAFNELYQWAPEWLASPFYRSNELLCRSMSPYGRFVWLKGIKLQALLQDVGKLLSSIVACKYVRVFVWLINGSTLICCLIFTFISFLTAPLEIIQLQPQETIENSQRTLVFLGVMTAQEFLDDRAKAVYETWGKDVPGRMAFFSSEGSVSKGMLNACKQEESL